MQACRHTYDPETFRLLRLSTTRLTDSKVLEDARWVHDAAGNVTFQEQAHSDTVWFDNAEVTPHRSYRYDALDRLVEATGREHDATWDGLYLYDGSGQWVRKVRAKLVDDHLGTSVGEVTETGLEIGWEE